MFTSFAALIVLAGTGCLAAPAPEPSIPIVIPSNFISVGPDLTLSASVLGVQDGRTTLALVGVDHSGTATLTIIEDKSNFIVPTATISAAIESATVTEVLALSCGISNDKASCSGVIEIPISSSTVTIATIESPVPLQTLVVEGDAPSSSQGSSKNSKSSGLKIHMDRLVGVLVGAAVLCTAL